MKRRVLFPLLFLYLCSCHQGPRTGDPVIAPGIVLKDLMSVLYYKRDHLRLSGNFTAYDTLSRKISNAQFYELFATGEYLPLRLNTGDSSVAYSLYRLPDTTETGVRNTLKQTGEEYYGYFKRTGAPFPPLDLADVNGRRFNAANTRGKLLVLKFWFIHCVACVKEMPRLNQLVAEYSKRDDILFLSFAFDSREQLAAFMKKTHFDYAVIPVPESYTEALNIHSYPTHMIIDRNGKIAKVTGNAEELALALEAAAGERPGDSR